MKIGNGRPPKPSRVTVLGITFKEDVPDTRNSKVTELVGILRDHGLEVQLHDPLIATHGSDSENGLTITPLNELKPAQFVVLAVPQGMVTLLVMPVTRMTGARHATKEGLHADVVALQSGSVGVIGADLAVVMSVAGALRA